MLYIKDFNLESIDYYRIQIVHKSFDNKENLYDHMEIWEKEIYSFSYILRRVHNARKGQKSLLSYKRKVVLISDEQIPREIYPTFEMTQDRTCLVHLSVVISGGGIRASFFL